MTTIGVAVLTKKRLSDPTLLDLLKAFDKVVVGFTGDESFIPYPVGVTPADLCMVGIQWTDSFSEARNKLLAHCTTDWVLWLDADEEIDPKEWGRSVRRRLARDEHISAYRLDLKNIVPDSNRVMGLDPLPLPDGTFASYHRGAMLRLHRNLPGISWKYRVHESLAPSLATEGRAIGEMRKTITHRGEVDRAVLAAKHWYYYGLSKKDSEENPKSPKCWFNLLAEAQAFGDWEVALDACRKYWSLTLFSSTYVFEIAAISQYNLGEMKEAQRYAEQIIARDPSNPIAVDILAECTAPSKG